MPLDLETIIKEVDSNTQNNGPTHLNIDKYQVDQEEKKKSERLQKEYNYSPDMDFWEWKETRSGATSLIFVYRKCYEFLQKNGFYRHEILGRGYVFVKITGKKVMEIQPYQIKDFVMEFLKKLGNEKVLEMMFKGGKSYLGPDSLSNLELKKLTFNRSTKNSQYFYLKNEVWKISSAGIKTIKYDQLPAYVWDTKIIDANPKLSEDSLFTVSKQKNKFKLDFSDIDKSDWLKYLFNTSRIHWREEQKRKLIVTEIYEQHLNFINKISALGYLLTTFRDESKSWAVVAMDSKESEVGDSNGGTGKSILGKAIALLNHTFYLDGKNKKLFDNPHIFHGLDDRTDLVFFDDVRIDFDFECLYPFITGVLNVNPKNGKPYTIPAEDVPKTYITTNHALKGNGDSDIRRQLLISFSDYYHRKRSPFDDFGKNLFSEAWDDEQWNVFYNVMALSVHYYMKYGKVEANIGNLEKRRQRQQMGELFLEWADEYFSSPEVFDEKLEKMKLHLDFKNKAGYYQEKYYSITRFKKCLKIYCRYNGYQFNPDKLDKEGKPGGDIKESGVEYIMIQLSAKEAPPQTPQQAKQGDLRF